MTDRTPLQTDPEAAPPCIVCGRDLGRIFDACGVGFSGSPGWGSRFDGSLRAEEQMRVVVCDDCLEAHALRVHLVRTKKTERTTAGPWSPRYDARECITCEET